jgi:hypothetical protein
MIILILKNSLFLNIHTFKSRCRINRVVYIYTALLACWLACLSFAQCTRQSAIALYALCVCVRRVVVVVNMKGERRGDVKEQ